MQTLWILLSLAVFAVIHCNAKFHIKPNRNSHEHCFTEQQLQESGDKVVEHFVGHKMDWRRYNSVKMVKVVENIERRMKRRKRTAQSGCPNYETLSKGYELSERSISPWSYRINVDENRYPQKLAFAQCLCNHCINSSTGRETSSLNSVLIHQSMLVLRKEKCSSDDKKYTFKMDQLSVPVACTCALPLYD